MPPVESIFTEFDTSKEGNDEMKISKSIRYMLEEDRVKSVFEHLRNLLVCVAILAAGDYAMDNPPAWMLNTFPVHFSGWAVIVLGILLMALNLADGIHRLSKLEHHTLLYALIVCLYLVASVQLLSILRHHA